MIWTILFDPDFELDFQKLDENVQDELLAQVILLRTFGPSLGRPSVDTLKGSIHANMKELRFKTPDGVWRVAFAFDPERSAVLLTAGNKTGIAQRRFYNVLVRTADQRFNQHLSNMKRQTDEDAHRIDGNTSARKTRKNPRTRR